MKPQVTIGVCAKNSALTISETIDSIISQGFPHELIEVIFVDDGSQDCTLSLMNARASGMDMQVKVIHHEWRGLGVSRNRVVEEAEGKYIIWVDSDMILSEDFVRRQVEFMEMNPKIGIAKGTLGILDQNRLVAFLEDVAYVENYYRHRGIAKSGTLGAGGCIYRVVSIRQVGGFDSNIKGVGEDMNAEAKVKKANWLLYVGSPGVFYEQRRSSLRSLWRESVWHGYGLHKIFEKRPIEVLGMTPPAAFFLGAYYSVTAYKMVHRRTVFLLPFQHAFARIGWWMGFLKGKIDKDYHSNLTG